MKTQFRKKKYLTGFHYEMKNLCVYVCVIFLFFYCRETGSDPKRDFLNTGNIVC